MEVGTEITYDIQEKTEKRPFENSPARNLLKEWCDVHDGIVPNFMKREELLAKEGGFLENREDGKKDFFIPEDIQLYELIIFIEVIDEDTFKDGSLAYKGEERKRKIQELGKTFEDAAVYMANRIESIKEGKAMAEEMIEGFYKYGKSLQKGGKYEGESEAEEIGKIKLSEERTRELDKWLAGDAYEQMARKVTEKKDEEEIRRENLAKYFKLGEILVRREKRQELVGGKTLLGQIRNAQEKAVNVPESEMDNAVFDRGVETLKNGLLSKLEQENSEAIRTIKEKLDIPSLKEAIGKARSEWAEEKDEVVKREKLARLAQIELDTAEAIQRETSALPWKDIYKPTEIVEKQALNCVGFSMLGGALFEEVGLKYLSVSVPKHSVLMLVTSDDKLRWFDMQNSNKNFEINDDDVTTNVKISEITKKINEETYDVGSFRIRSDCKKFRYTRPRGSETYLSFGANNRELVAQIYQAVGLKFQDQGKNVEAKLAYMKVNEVDRNFVQIYKLLATLSSNPEEKRELYRKVFEMNPSDSFAYSNLASMTIDLEEKLRLYQKAFELDENNAMACVNLGRLAGDVDEKIAFYKKAISLVEDDVKNGVKITQFGLNMDKSRIKLAMVYHDLSKCIDYPPERLRLLKRAVELNPNDEFMIYKLGLATSDLNEKETLFLKVIELNPKNYNAYHALSKIYKEWGDVEKEEESYRKFSEMVRSTKSA